METPAAVSQGAGAPFILRVTPAPKSVDVGISDPICVEFGRDMDKKTVMGSISLYGPNNKKLEGEILYHGRTAEFRSSELLDYSKTYRVVLGGGLSDSSGRRIEKGSSWTFTTNNGIAPRIRVKNNGSIILSDITGYDYYAQDSSSKSPPAEFTVQNEGTADLVIWSLGFVSGEKEQFTLSSPECPVTLHPGASCSFTIVFHPDTTGKKTAYLKIKSNDASFGFFNLMVTGTGV
jgi:hypothetical protein